MVTDGELRDIEASAIAPDTRGMNFYRDDQALQDLLAMYLPDDLFAHLLPHLNRLGGLAAGELDECAALADRHPPVLHARDRFGRDRQWIEYHPAYRRLEAVAYGEFGIHAMSHRPILGWSKPLPAVAKHAFTLLFNEAEFGLGCPINVTDSAAHLLIRFGDEGIKERFLPRMLSQDMNELWQGAQFMTEKSGGSDVGGLTSTAVRDGENWRIYGEKWFCSNADANVVTLLARPEGAAQGTKGLGLFVMPR
jgi:acyl-CoA dehydrogenase